MANKLKSIKKEKINLPKTKKETSSQRASTKKNLGNKKSDEVEALTLTWNEDLCE